MEFLRPATLAEALAAKAAHPDAVPIAGGTDVMVELNFDHRRPTALLDLGRVAELHEHTADGGRIRIGAAVPYARIITELGTKLPGLAMAARTVGSPQIRNRGSVGGNLGAASPAGDSHPPLLAADADVEIASATGARTVPAREFYLGVKRNVLAPDELITAVHVAPASGPQQFSKIGTRNAMVIAVCAFGLALHPDRQRVGTGVGSAAPTPRRAGAAEEFLAGELTDRGLWESPRPLEDSVLRRFGTLVAEAAAPIDDVRGSADYRRHALSVMARRTLRWAWDDYREGSWPRCA
ncbi:FAD binding domain-containing protein [Amycolatopsis suaedae]|uniref:Xanthine dehydrogenase family protein subunit M n=1 Tax=Amycolatopsis suaedae TaxID=2510978 RepID=A0A4Q7J8D0_9PSEU|nr:FAD binding domain-containing protein [Amycolatopsis suaedae]RZQ63951.1 xanthine dehydrogenase family protein subunit M [Amycolatopsis suaedae]